jgi:hypothetical protein
MIIMQYLLTIRVPYEALDDLEARKKAIRYLADVSEILPESKEKLQEVFSNKTPRSIPL